MAGGVEEHVEVELGVAEVEIAVGEQEGVAAVAIVVELEGGVVAAAGERAFDGGGEFVGDEFDCEEAGAGGRRKGRLPTRGDSAPMGMPGMFGLVIGVPIVAATASELKDCRTREAR